MRGTPLLPWPNRVRDGRWRWNGQDLQLEVQSPQAPTAIHGLVSAQPWTILATEEGAVTVGTMSGLTVTWAASLAATRLPAKAVSPS